MPSPGLWLQCFVTLTTHSPKIAIERPLLAIRLDFESDDAVDVLVKKPLPWLPFHALR